MTELSTYAFADGVATITLDDGRVNALSQAMLAELMTHIARAESEDAIIVLTGREKTFSAGFDLRCPPEKFLEMVCDGAKLAERLLAYPRPVVAACTGNAVAMGAFTLLACDVRIGAAGPFKIGLNEVSIGLFVPWFGIELARHRLTPPYFDRCTITGAILDPEEARTAGFLDEVVAPGAVATVAEERAAGLAAVDAGAHRTTKARTRERVLAGVRDGIARFADDRDV
ncbi:MAG: enoyl-CoA hydratase [Solirubrobacteraceae bacterium]|nr:enoyl-CoA hydratase [Solirubrobacteraceae bacterium]